MARPTTSARDGRGEGQLLEEELSGLDALELPLPARPHPIERLWASAWPKLLAVGIVLAVWQAVVWSGWRPEDQLPSPTTVLRSLGENFGTIMSAAGVTLARGAVGFPLAVALGTVLGVVVARVRVLRAATGSLITGLLTMPSVAWFPFAVLLFGPTTGAVFFVVVMGGAPAAASGLVTGIDHISPALIRTGRVLGARRATMLRHVILPAALPSYVAGLKSAWAFSWRALLAGELLVRIPGALSLGEQLDRARASESAAELLAVTLVILMIGTIIDALVFSNAERRIRRRYGLVDSSDAT